MNQFAIIQDLYGESLDQDENSKEYAVTLYPAKTEGEIVNLANELGIDLPEELREFYQVSYGALFDDFEILTLEDIAILKSSFQSDYFGDSFLPFARLRAKGIIAAIDMSTSDVDENLAIVGRYYESSPANWEFICYGLKPLVLSIYHPGHRVYWSVNLGADGYQDKIGKEIKEGLSKTMADAVRDHDRLPEVKHGRNRNLRKSESELPVSEAVAQFESSPLWSVFEPDDSPQVLIDPRAPDVIIPEAVLKYYKLCGGQETIITTDDNIVLSVVRPEEFEWALKTVLGKFLDRQIDTLQDGYTWKWYVIGRGDTDDYFVIDLCPKRYGYCYFTTTYTFGQRGLIPIVATSFEGLLQQLHTAAKIGEDWDWYKTSLGDLFNILDEHDTK